MPALNTGNSGAYWSEGKWCWFQSRMLDMRDEGWKLHVSGDAENAQLIMDLVLPVLRTGNVAHKVLPDTEAIEKQVGEQQGKFLAVYPDSIVYAFVIVSEIDNVLGAKVKPHDSPKIMHERRVGLTVVYTRYGAYNDAIYNPIKGEYVPDTRGEYKPDWIKDPWDHYPNVSAVTQFALWPKHDKKGWGFNPRKINYNVNKHFN